MTRSIFDVSNSAHKYRYRNLFGSIKSIRPCVLICLWRSPFGTVNKTRDIRSVIFLKQIGDDEWLDTVFLFECVLPKHIVCKRNNFVSLILLYLPIHAYCSIKYIRNVYIFWAYAICWAALLNGIKTKTISTLLECHTHLALKVWYSIRCLPQNIVHWVQTKT